ncbi:MAG: hypothetical protein A2X32_06895 [Elusimicrobia bacterium GWC2_64_44]|nr:MAG: hypothetical protein A2X32_06895 [Elusimicrobia bacterium GWC2_64_44]
MKNFLLPLALLLTPCAAPAADDCAKSTDACSAGAKQLSPFAAASLAKDEAPRSRVPVLKQAPAPSESAPQAPAAVSTAPAPAAPAAASRQALSSPAWLVFVAGALAGLYFYLRSGSKRGRRK